MISAAYSFTLATRTRVSFDMSRATLKPASPIPVFTLLHNGIPYVTDLGSPIEFVTHAAAETFADDLAGKVCTDRNCFKVVREWL